MKTKSIFSVSSIILVFLLLSTQSFCSSAIELKEWHPYSGIKNISYDDSIMKVESASRMPLLISPDNLFINSKKHNFLIIKMKTDSSYSNGRLFFRRIGDKGFNYINSEEIPVGLNNIYHTYIINLKNNPSWNSVVNQLVFCPASAKGDMEIKSIKLVKENIFLNIASVWQEISKFERPLPRTINFIYGPKINRTLINSYIYSLIILISILLIGFYAIKFKNLDKLLNTSIAKIIIVCFAFWILLDARTAVEQFRSTVLDYQIFGGKTLEEKQALSTYGSYYDFYYFLKQCNAKIPSGSSYLLKVPPNYFYHGLKARYYLYPTYEIEKKPAYIIVYDPQRLLKNIDIPNKDYKEYYLIKERGYILKRIISL